MAEPEDDVVKQLMERPELVLLQANARVISNLVELNKIIGASHGQDCIRAMNAYGNNVTAWIQVQTAAMMLKQSQPQSPIITLPGTIH